jgi:hypothetical protein
MSGDHVAAAARALVGTRFRLHGRDPATGLDCVGLVAAALAGAGWEGRVPSGYPLRGGEAGRIAALLDRDLARTSGARPGCVALAMPGAGQFHLLVMTAQGFVHADAGLRRVVERPGAPPWPLFGFWCIEEEKRSWRP